MTSGGAARGPTIADLEAAARAGLHPAAYAFYAAGADEEVTAGEAVGAWHRWRIRPHVLAGVAQVDTSVTVLGRTLSMPVLAAPTALHVMAHSGAEVETARGVRDAGAAMVLSSRSWAGPAEVAAQAGPWWYQVYVLRDRGVTREQVTRATECGAEVLVLTVDAPVLGCRPRSAGPLPLPPGAAAGLDPATRPDHLRQDPALAVADIGWLAEMSGLPVIVKGILRGDDAVRCMAAGAAGIIVSNHGGRQLDRVQSTAHALPEVVRAVGDQVPVLVDGGVRSGLDVFTALALGARAVLVGRPVLWALAVGGADGVRHLFEAFRDELATAMIMAGTARTVDVVRNMLAVTPLVSPDMPGRRTIE
jgi:4-hydroxymandelate oxidase